MRRALTVAILVAGCGGGHVRSDPTVGLLAVGVDPRAEADATVAGLARGGYRLAARDDGETAVALAFRNEARGESAVRVITRRGIALALDVPGEESAEPVGLFPDTVRDVDGDGQEEVLLSRADPVYARRCHAVLRVDREGLVHPVQGDLARFGADACIEDLRDLNGDGALDAVVVWRIASPATEGTPDVEVPFAIEAGRLLPVPQRFATFLAEARGGRHLGLAAARHERDVPRALTLAVELAAIERVSGAPMAVQVGAFDDALRGLVLHPREADAVAEARRRIAAGW